MSTHEDLEPLKGSAQSDGTRARFRSSMSDGTKEAASLLEMSELLSRLDHISLADLATERSEAMTPVERLIEKLSTPTSVKKVRKKVKKRKPGRPKLHWKTRKKNHRLAMARWHEKVRAPAQRLINAERLSTPEGTWEYLRNLGSWSRGNKKPSWDITVEEFVEHVYPLMKGRLPRIYRLDLEGTVTLENTLWKCRDSGEVIWDGHEYVLRKSGSIL